MNKIKTLMSVPGISGRTNDILLALPEKTLDTLVPIVVYFGGDVQDLEENMTKHRDNHRYKDWSLERTTELLSKTYPDRFVVTVRPSRLEYGTFSCYENFVELSDKIGSPNHNVTHQGLDHLRAILESLEMRSEFKNGGDIDLVGFSKGVVVLNQILCELSNHENAERNSEILKRIGTIHWLDGGHNGGKDTWVTQSHIVEAFSLTGIKVDIRVTPYQVKDDRRPWIGKEEKRFHRLLQQFKIEAKRNIFFEDEEPTIEKHFQVLNFLNSPSP